MVGTFVKYIQCNICVQIVSYDVIIDIIVKKKVFYLHSTATNTPNTMMFSFLQKLFRNDINSYYAIKRV
jgi:hypothetical protein